MVRVPDGLDSYQTEREAASPVAARKTRREIRAVVIDTPLFMPRHCGVHQMRTARKRPDDFMWRSSRFQPTKWTIFDIEFDEHSTNAA